VSSDATQQIFVDPLRAAADVVGLGRNSR